MRFYLCLLFLGCCLSGPLFSQESEQAPKLPKEALNGFDLLTGITFTDAEKDLMLKDLAQQLEAYRYFYNQNIANWVQPAFRFDPLQGAAPPPARGPAARFNLPSEVRLPENREDLAFYSVAELSVLIHNQQISSVELTQFFLDRLRKYDPKLMCVVSLTETRALKQAAQMDEELAAGHSRGPLHGIPYGAKDLFAVPEYKTTWGAMAYKDQILDDTATVVRKLDEAGAVLVAKLSLGALAMGDVWFKGTTKNPWNMEQGSSGSSAGSASAVAAGLVPFALGTETLGSIVSPSTRCHVTGFRPTYGAVSRAGAMTLSWTMDKAGPIARNVRDCAMVFDAIRGRDPRDPSTLDAAFPYVAGRGLGGLRIGYHKSAFESDYPNKAQDQAVLDVYRKAGAELIAIDLPATEEVIPLLVLLSAECAAAFQTLTLENRDDLLVRQDEDAWPNTFRAGNTVPAAAYIQANRLRTRLIERMRSVFEKVDVYITPSFQGSTIYLTNFTGHPCIALPNGFAEDGTPVSFTVVGNLYGEAEMAAVAEVFQAMTDHDEAKPNLD